MPAVKKKKLKNSTLRIGRIKKKKKKKPKKTSQLRLFHKNCGLNYSIMIDKQKENS
jgi:hypothetical protein